MSGLSLILRFMSPGDFWHLPLEQDDSQWGRAQLESQGSLLGCRLGPRSFLSLPWLTHVYSSMHPFRDTLLNPSAVTQEQGMG